MAKSSLASVLWATYQRSPARDAQDKAAREALIVGQLPLVHKLARELSRVLVHVEYCDLVQAGMIGLVSAADNYHPEKGKFEPFAWFRVHGAIIDSNKRKAWREDMNNSLDAMADRHDGWLPPSIDTCPDPMPDEATDRKQMYEKLAAAVESLPPADAALLRSWMNGAPIRDQCKISGMSANSTRGRLAEIVAKVRTAVLTGPPGSAGLAEFPRPRLAVPLRACA